MKKYLAFAMVVVLAVVLVSPFSVSAKTKAGTKSGSFFYFFDTAFEKAGLFFTFNPEKKAKKALENAEERLAEAEELANENKPEAVVEAMENYKKNIEVLEKVLIKVPEEAKEAIEKAIEASKERQEETMKETTELEKEVSEIKPEVEETENELKEEENEEEAETKDDKKDEQSKEIEKLKKEVEGLKQKTSQIKVIEKVEKPVAVENKQISSSQTISQTKQKEVTLPNGAVVEMDENGNVVRTIKKVLKLPTQVYVPVFISPQTQTQSSASQSISQRESSSQSQASQAKIDMGFLGNDSRSILATGWTAKNIYALVYGDKGEKLSNVRINVTTPDENQNKAIDYANMGTQNGIQGAFWFSYYPKFAGTHTITFSVPSYGLSKSIGLEATPYTRLLPTMRLDFSNPQNLSVETNYSYPQNVVVIRVDNPDLGDQYYLKDVFYKIISDEITEGDIKLNLWHNDSPVDQQNPFGSAMYDGSSKILTIKTDGMSKAGKFKLSISARFFSANEVEQNQNKEFVLSDIPLVTPEIEIK